MKYLWEIVKRDGEIITLPEAAARAAKAQWVAGKPINFVEQAFAASEVREIRATSKVDTEGQHLLADGEAALSAGKPIIVTSDSGEQTVRANRVVKQVTRQEWEKLYSKSPGYECDKTREGYWVIYTRPAHLGIPPGQELYAGNR